MPDGYTLARDGTGGQLDVTPQATFAAPHLQLGQVAKLALGTSRAQRFITGRVVVAPGTVGDVAGRGGVEPVIESHPAGARPGEGVH